MNRMIAVLFLGLFVSALSHAAEFLVTNTRDAGAGSLREALNACNRNGGNAEVVFEIPKSDTRYDPKAGTWTILYEDTPPSITVSHVTINGFSQSARRGETNPNGPAIVLSGGKHSVEYAFVLINASEVTIKGLVIDDFVYGIQIYGAGSHHNRITGNYIGVDASGVVAAGNYNGIELLSEAHDNVVGGTNADERNVVSGNEHIGIRISDAHRNRILGNYVGTDRSGLRAVPNYDGICAEGRSKGNVIGGAESGARNIASGNVAYGMDLFGAGVQENQVLGNFIGTDVTGTKALANTYGILFDDRAARNVVGGMADGEGNLISGNTAFGAYFYNNGTNSNVLLGNRIGTDITGTRALANETGVHIDGGTFKNRVEKNLISGNVVAGVTIFALYSDGNTLKGNHIGTDLSGSKPLPNGEDGVRIAFGPKGNLIGGDADAPNVIAFNGKRGVAVESDESLGNRVSCNEIYSNRQKGISVLRGTPLATIAKPVFTSVRQDAGKCVISGKIDIPAPETAVIEVFIGDQNAAGPIQGRKFIARTQPDRTGAWSITTEWAKTARLFAATATDKDGNTSEFGQWPAE